LNVNTRVRETMTLPWSIS